MILETDATEVGRRNIAIGAVTVALVSAAQWFLSTQPDVSSGLIYGLWLFALIFSGVFLWTGILLVRSGGSWRVQIDQSGIDWSSPNESVDKSFNFKLTEIEKIQTRIKRKKRGRKKTRYYIHLKNGTKKKLSPNGGVDREKVFAELEQLGVKFENGAT